jgi:hypothetical protein
MMGELHTLRSQQTKGVDHNLAAPAASNCLTETTNNSNFATKHQDTCAAPDDHCRQTGCEQLIMPVPMQHKVNIKKRQQPLTSCTNDASEPCHNQTSKTCQQLKTAAQNDH